MSRYRFTTLPSGARHGPWRTTRREALEDALAADCAEADDAAEGGIQLDLMVIIEEETPAHSISQAELWACATEVVKQHGDDAPRHIAERIGDLALKCDVAGVQTWKAIAGKVDQLRRRPERPQ